MMGMFLLLGLHGGINHGLRPLLARRGQRRRLVAPIITRTEGNTPA